MNKPTKIPPGQRIARDFPVLHLGNIPKFNPDNWNFFIDGEVENTLKFGWAELNGLPKVNQISDFHCVTGWSRLQDKWEGIQVKALLNRARPLPNARYALAFADEDYSTSLPLEVLQDEDVILALYFNGKPLEPIHGGPVRLLVPKKYAYKSAKWARGIRLFKEPQLGFWESRGYSDSADPWVEERYT